MSGTLDITRASPSLYGFARFRKERESSQGLVDRQNRAFEGMYGLLIQLMRKFPRDTTKRRTIEEAKAAPRQSLSWIRSIVPTAVSKEMRIYGFLRHSMMLAVKPEEHKKPKTDDRGGARRRDFGSGWKATAPQIPVRRMVKQHIDGVTRFMPHEDMTLSELITDFQDAKQVCRFLRSIGYEGDTVHAIIGEATVLPFQDNEQPMATLVREGEGNDVDMARSVFFNSCGTGSCVKFIRGAGGSFRMLPGKNAPPHCKYLFVHVGPVTPVNAACNIDVPMAIGVNVIIAARDPESQAFHADGMRFSLALQVVVVPLKRAVVSLKWGKSNRLPRETDCVAVDVPWVLRDWRYPDGLPYEKAIQELDPSDRNADNLNAVYAFYQPPENDVLVEQRRREAAARNRDDSIRNKLAFEDQFGIPHVGVIANREFFLMSSSRLKASVFNGFGPAFSESLRLPVNVSQFRHNDLTYIQEQGHVPCFVTVRATMRRIFAKMPLVEMMNRIETYEPDTTLSEYPLQSMQAVFNNNAVWPLQYSMEFVGPFLRSQIMLMYHTHMLKLVVVGLTLDCMRLVGMFGDQHCFQSCEPELMMKYMLIVFAEDSLINDEGVVSRTEEFTKIADPSSYRTAFATYVKKIMYMWHQMVGTFPFGASRQRDCTMRELHKTRYGLEILIDNLVIRRWNLICRTKEWIEAGPSGGKSHNNPKMPSFTPSAGARMNQDIIDPDTIAVPFQDTGRQLSRRLELELMDTISDNPLLQASIDDVIAKLKPMADPKRPFALHDMLSMDSSGTLQCAMIRIPLDIASLHIYMDLGNPVSEFISGWYNIQHTFMNPRDAFGIPDDILSVYIPPDRDLEGRERDFIIRPEIRMMEAELFDNSKQWKQAIDQAIYRNTDQPHESTATDVRRIRKLPGRTLYTKSDGARKPILFNPRQDSCAAYTVRGMGALDYFKTHMPFTQAPLTSGGDGLVKLRLDMKTKTLEICVVDPAVALTKTVQKIPDNEQSTPRETTEAMQRSLRGILRAVRDLNTPTRGAGV